MPVKSESKYVPGVPVKLENDIKPQVSDDLNKYNFLLLTLW